MYWVLAKTCRLSNAVEKAKISGCVYMYACIQVMENSSNTYTLLDTNNENSIPRWLKVGVLKKSSIICLASLFYLWWRIYWTIAHKMCSCHPRICVTLYGKREFVVKLSKIKRVPWDRQIILRYKSGPNVIISRMITKRVT